MGDMQTCECGTFAIGLCSQCGIPVCMHHSRLLNGVSRCLAHHEAALGAAPTAAAPEQVAAPETPDRRGRRGWGRRR